MPNLALDITPSMSHVSKYGLLNLANFYSGPRGNICNKSESNPFHLNRFIPNEE